MEGPDKYLEVQHTRQHQDQDEAYGPHKPQNEGQGHRLLLRVGLTILCQGGVTMKVPRCGNGCAARRGVNWNPFPTAQLLEWCAHYRLEGVANKKVSSPYSSGTRRSWVKAQQLAGS